MLEWDQLEEMCRDCRRCPLCLKRTKVVFGMGDRKADLMFIGEAPGRDEDLQGKPFVGRAGQLLDKIFDVADIKKEEVYISNIVKCRPPGNRVPKTDEAERCIPYLRNQVYLIKPKIIVCLGATAARHIINNDIRITKDRGQWIQRKGCWLFATYHPAALLRDENKKRPVWEDFKNIRKKLEEIKNG